MTPPIIPELLAPAGAMEQLITAIRYGADAVYVGTKRFGLREYAGNFSVEELALASSICHQNNKKIYVTMNSYLFDDELDDFMLMADAVYQAGADAVIVSDMGAVSMLKDQLPELAVHISTQANTLNSAAVMAYRAMGAKRVIVARELSIDRLAQMRAIIPPDIQLEAFCHGAVCMAYSGRCILSSVLTNRSANQGRCAQPCRWKYALTEEKRPGEYMPIDEDANGTYLLSARDLNLMPLLPRLINCGLSSIKIEGRMKSEYYVAGVVSAYRHGLDALRESIELFNHNLPSLMNELEKVSHRRYDTGFAERMPGNDFHGEGVYQSMEYTGCVMANGKAGEPVMIELKNRFFINDALEVLTPQKVLPFTPNKMILADTGESVQTCGIAGTLLKVVFPYDVSRGDIIRGPVRNHPR